MTAEQKNKISKFCKDNPEKVKERSEKVKKFYRDNPEKVEEIRNNNLGIKNPFFGKTQIDNNMLSKETKLKIGLGNKGKITPHSEETKLKIGLGNKGKKRTLAVIEKYRQANLGKTLSKETKLKISKNNKNQAFHNSIEYKQKLSKLAYKRSVGQYDLNGIFINKFESCVVASKETGIPRTSINACCLGKLKHAGNFCWKIINE